MSFHQNLRNSRCMGKKKGFSYASLISQALLSSPNNRLTLKEIYSYISINYPEFTDKKKGWQNSIRHNLSLNKAFLKEPKLKGTPGKGSYWSIDHSEAKLLLDKAEIYSSRIRRGYGHTNQSTHRKKSPYLEEIHMTDETKIKPIQSIKHINGSFSNQMDCNYNSNLSIFNGHLNDQRLNPFNSSLEAYFGMSQRLNDIDHMENDEEDIYNQEYAQEFKSNVSDYFRFE